MACLWLTLASRSCLHSMSHTSSYYIAPLHILEFLLQGIRHRGLDTLSLLTSQRKDLDVAEAERQEAGQLLTEFRKVLLDWPGAAQTNLEGK